MSYNHAIKVKLIQLTCAIMEHTRRTQFTFICMEVCILAVIVMNYSYMFVCIFSYWLQITLVEGTETKYNLHDVVFYCRGVARAY